MIFKKILLAEESHYFFKEHQGVLKERTLAAVSKKHDLKYKYFYFPGLLRNFPSKLYRYERQEIVYCKDESFNLEHFRTFFI